MIFNPFARLSQAAVSIVASIAIILALVGAAAFAIQSARIDGFLWFEGFKPALAAREKTITALKDASAAAGKKAEAQRITTENRYAQAARRADNAENQNANLRDAADRFAAARSLRGVSAGASCGPAAPAPGDPAGDRDGPGDDAVVLTRPEYDQFVANTLRLEDVRQWGEALITDSLALPAAEFGEE